MTFANAHLRPRREKLFGDGRPLALDRNAKARVLHLEAAEGLTGQGAKVAPASDSRD
jgi:hypothetical protein